MGQASEFSSYHNVDLQSVSLKSWMWGISCNSQIKRGPNQEVRTRGSSITRSKFTFYLDYFVSLAIELYLSSFLLTKEERKHFFDLKMKPVLLKKDQKGDTHISGKIKSVYLSTGLWSPTAHMDNCLLWRNNLLPISSLFCRPTFLSLAAWVTPFVVMN